MQTCCQKNLQALRNNEQASVWIWSRPWRQLSRSRPQIPVLLILWYQLTPQTRHQQFSTDKTCHLNDPDPGKSASHRPAPINSMGAAEGIFPCALHCCKEITRTLPPRLWPHSSPIQSLADCVGLWIGMAPGWRVGPLQVCPALEAPWQQTAGNYFGNAADNKVLLIIGWGLQTALFARWVYTKWLCR